jgi:hypothetical protein
MAAARLASGGSATFLLGTPCLAAPLSLLHVSPVVFQRLRIVREKSVGSERGPDFGEAEAKYETALAKTPAVAVMFGRGNHCLAHHELSIFDRGIELQDQSSLAVGLAVQDLGSVGRLGDEGSDQYRVGEDGMRVPPDAVPPRGEVDLERRQFDRAVTYARYWAGGVAG